MKKTVCMIASVLLLTLFCSAEGDLYESLGVRDMVRSAPAESDIEFSEEVSLNDGLSGVWEKLLGSLRDMLGSGLRCAGVVVAVSLLGGIVESVSIAGDKTVQNALSLVGALAIITAASGNITSVVGMGRSFMSSVDVFSKALLPSVAAAEAACGLPGAAVAKAAATLVFSDVLINVINYVLMPLVYVGIFASTANAAAENEALRKISGFSRKFVGTALKVIIGAFVSYISVLGLVSGGVDKGGLKTIQMTLGTVVPVVGASISEAAETVIAGANLMKNAIGVFGMLTILSAFVSPFAALLINYSSFKLASLLSAPLVGNRISELSSSIAESFGLVLAMCASVATVILISVIAAMQGVGVL